MSSPRMTRRERQALQTRAEILDAALSLFAANGYGATTVADIAGTAGVAIATVYTSVGTKPQLLEHLLARVVELVGVPELAAQGMATTKPEEVLRIQAHITRLVVERTGDIVRVLGETARESDETAAAYAEGLRRHREGAQFTVDRLVALDALAVPAEDAFAVVLGLTNHHTYETLRDAGWSYERSEQWIAETLRLRLLRSRRRRAS